MNPLLKLANKAVLQQDLLYKLRDIDQAQNSYKVFKDKFDQRFPGWRAEPGAMTQATALIGLILKTYPVSFFLYFVSSIAFSAIEFLKAGIMNLALKGLETISVDSSPMEKVRVAGWLIAALVGSDLALTVLKSQNNFIMVLLTRRIRNGLNALIYEKVSMKSMKRDLTFSIGELVNITESDTTRISDMGSYANRVIIAPFEIIVGTIWMFRIVGFWPLAWGMLIMATTLIINVNISSFYFKYKLRYMGWKDKRGKLVTETFSNIRYIKMAGLENNFLMKICEVKSNELRWALKTLGTGIITITINNSAPIMFLAVIFSTYIYFHGALSVPMIFLVIQMYNIFSSNFQSLPYMITYVTDVLVSSQRILFFLLSENLEEGYIQRLPPSRTTTRIGGEDGDFDEKTMAIQIEDGNFFWEDPDLRYLYRHEKDRIAAKEDDKKAKGSIAEDMQNNKQRAKTELVERKKMSEERQRFSTMSFQDAESFMNESMMRDVTVEMTQRSLTQETSLTEDTIVSVDPDESRRTELTDKLMETFATNDQSVYDGVYEGIDLNLKNINISIEEGKCVAIIGKVGSGKSSLLSCLGGELYHRVGSRITLRGSVAYVGQKAWIQSKTIKDNILFGKEFDQKRYDDSIKYACMTDDMKILAKEDQTMLGDKGVNLSGGQKIRLSIARAMYSDADIYLFDDPISALDIHVGKYVMEQGILNFLRGTTRVVATHAIAYLKLFDYIYVMDQGEIFEEGTYEKVIKTKVYQEIERTLREEQEKEEEKSQRSSRKSSITEEDFLEELANASSHQASFEKEKADSVPSIKSIPSLKSDKETALTKEPKKEPDSKMKPNLNDIGDETQKEVIQDIIACEDRTEGNISFEIVKEWRSLNGGFPATMWLILVLTVSSFSRAGIPFFLQWWSSNFAVDGSARIHEFIAIYLSISAITLVCDYFRIATIFKNNVEMSREVNFKMTFQLVHASVNKFFDRVPLGRIINRFIKDTEDIDVGFPWTADWFFNANFVCMSTFIACCVSSSPINFIFVIIYSWISFKIQRYFMNTLREVTRLKAIASSPSIQAFKEEIEGISTIRYFGAYEGLFREYLGKVDDLQKNIIVFTAVQEWFSITVSMLTLFVIIPCVITALFFVNLSTGMFGFMLNYLLQTTVEIRSILNVYGQLETRLISLERCSYFMKVKPEEGYKGLDLLENALRQNKNVNLDLSKLSWPSRGKLEIKNLFVRYRQDLPDVLKNINLTIEPGTKVGIVGRTGAGKSTLISALYRTFDQYKGDIVYDGLEIRQIDLKVLRNSMTIIPQDPYVFADSLRNNMDPVGKFSDEAIIDILRKVNLWRKFKEMDGLESTIEGGGSNVSQGEKQLLCLARALLFDNRLVLMDEATANIDTQTEVLIQRLIKEKFVNSTILMIAHRLNTILHCDKVLVLEQGNVLEYDNLENLKGNENSHFGRMLMKSDEIKESLK